MLEAAALRARADVLVEATVCAGKGALVRALALCMHVGPGLQRPLHVLPGEETLVWDLDCALGFGVPFDSWATKSLRPSVSKRASYAQSFRVASAADFLTGFASDRSHMRRDDGAFAMPPPQQPCIVASSGATHTLPTWWDMTHAEPGYGVVQDLSSFVGRFGAPRAKPRPPATSAAS